MSVFEYTSPDKKLIFLVKFQDLIVPNPDKLKDEANRAYTLMAENIRRNQTQGCMFGNEFTNDSGSVEEDGWRNLSKFDYSQRRRAPINIAIDEARNFSPADMKKVNSVLNKNREAVMNTALPAPLPETIPYGRAQSDKVRAYFVAKEKRDAADKRLQVAREKSEAADASFQKASEELKTIFGSTETEKTVQFTRDTVAVVMKNNYGAHATLKTVEKFPNR